MSPKLASPPVLGARPVHVQALLDLLDKHT
jgi:hypothetical protein